jgi:transposase-like protein
MAQNKDSDKAQALSLFIKTDLPLQAIAQALGVNPSTLSRWRNDENWDDIKAAELNSLSNTISNLKETISLKSSKLVEMARNGEDTSGLTDEISKLNSTLREYTGVMPLTDYITVLEEFVNFTPKEEIKAFLARQENSKVATLKQFIATLQIQFIKSLVKK